MIRKWPFYFVQLFNVGSCSSPTKSFKLISNNCFCHCHAHLTLINFLWILHSILAIRKKRKHFWLIPHWARVHWRKIYDIWVYLCINQNFRFDLEFCEVLQYNWYIIHDLFPSDWYCCLYCRFQRMNWWWKFWLSCQAPRENMLKTLHRMLPVVRWYFCP